MKTNLHPNDAAKRLAHGRMACTLVSKSSGQHITLRFRCKNNKIKGAKINLEQAAIIAIDVPSARNDDGTYTSGGDRVAWVHPTKGLIANKNADAARFWCAKTVWHYLHTGEMHKDVEFGLEDQCGRCSRPINDPESKRRGLGPECYGKQTKSQHAPKVDTVEHQQLLEV